MSWIYLSFVLTCAFLTAPAQSGPQVILFNGKIFTGDKASPFAEAVEIRGERIVLVGSTKAVMQRALPVTSLIDLKGRTVVPGFNDAHAHFSAPPSGTYLEFSSMEPTLDEVVETLRAEVKRSPKGGWIFGTIGGKAMADRRANKASLDEITKDRPVMLTAYYGHGRIFNQAAMKKLEITEKVQDVVGGVFERHPSTGRLNGRVFGYAQWQYDRRLAAEVEDAKVIEALKAMSAEAIGYGITSLQIMPEMSIDRFVKLARKAELPVRIRAIPFSLTTNTGRDNSEIKALRSLRSEGSNVTPHGIKWILDGTPFERGAAMRKPYADMPESMGRMNFSTAVIEDMLRESIAENEQILLHAVGDRTVEAVLDAMEKLGPEIDWPAKRVRIEHGEGVSEELIARAAKFGVTVVQNPTHFSLVEMLYARWTPGMKYSTQRSLIDGGVNYALGSDGPPNPGLNIMLAVMHPARTAEGISREQAVVAYTRGSSFAELAEKEKGTIAPGKLADLAVLSQDIFAIPLEALPGTKSVLTMIGGKIVHNELSKTQ